MRELFLGKCRMGEWCLSVMGSTLPLQTITVRPVTRDDGWIGFWVTPTTNERSYTCSCHFGDRKFFTVAGVNGGIFRGEFFLLAALNGKERDSFGSHVELKRI